MPNETIKQILLRRDGISSEVAREDRIFVEEWTKEDSQTAQSQGWNLFKVSIEGRIVSLIERCDEMDTFEDDDKAFAFVKQQAAAGDQLAAKALRFDYEGRSLQ